jgi:hypothetical protein
MRSNFSNVGEVKFHGDDIPWGEMKVAWGKLSLQTKGKLPRKNKSSMGRKRSSSKYRCPREKKKLPRERLARALPC